MERQHVNPNSLPNPTGELGPNFQFTSVSGQHRVELVELAGNMNLVGASFLTANEFDLSALGASVDLEGIWNVSGLGIGEWKHVATGGRDQYVRIVTKGHLFPYGHRAVYVQVFERVLEADPVGQWSDAVVQETSFLKVLQPTMEYGSAAAPGATGQPFHGNSWPFASITMKTLITPPLASFTAVPFGSLDSLEIIAPPKLNPQGPAQAVLIYSLNNTEVSWSAEGVDWAGNEVHIDSPLVFMFGYDVVNHYGNEFDPEPYSKSAPLDNYGTTKGVSSQVAEAYNALAASHRTATTYGAKIRYAPPVADSSPQGGTMHPTTSLVMLASTAFSDPTAPGASWPAASLSELFYYQQPAFYPAIGSARVHLPAAEGLSRTSFNDSTSGSTGGVALEYYADWVEASIPSSPYAFNSGSVYMQFADYANAGNNPAKGPTLQFPGDAVGGIATPNVNATGLSANAGLVSGPLETYATTGRQSPASYFPGLTGSSAPQLLGGLTLGTILGSFLNENGLPNIVNDPDPVTGIRTVTYSMVAQTTQWPNTNTNPNANPIFQPLGNNPNSPAPGDGTMTLTAVITISPSGSSTYVVNGSISPFVINILGQGSSLDFLLIPFNKCTFSTQSGSKPDIHVEIGNVQFQGALTFVNALEQFLEALGGSGFQVTVTPTQISAGFSISLPDIGIGIVDISNLGMSASVVVPFLGAPALATFSFASQEKQFLVTVSMFGGSGFITLVLGLQSVQQISASIEFAGNFSLDLYVASGGITLTAGIYYNYSAPGQPMEGVTLSGFVKLVGSLEVLGIISVTVELDLSLTYYNDPTTNTNYVEGTATLSASIHIIFFTITIPITIHKQFTGSSGSSSASPMEKMMASVPKALGEKHAPHILPHQDPVPVDTVGFAGLITDANTWASYCDAFGG
jgi:hypothetical protein